MHHSICHYNPLGLVWWYWLRTWECAPPRGLKFDSLKCQFRWANLASSKKLYLSLFYSLLADNTWVTLWLVTLVTLPTTMLQVYKTTKKSCERKRRKHMWHCGWPMSPMSPTQCHPSATRFNTQHTLFLFPTFHIILFLFHLII